jgi:hypothetical protein
MEPFFPGQAQRFAAEVAKFAAAGLTVAAYDELVFGQQAAAAAQDGGQGGEHPGAGGEGGEAPRAEVAAGQEQREGEGEAAEQEEAGSRGWGLVPEPVGGLSEM